MANGFRSSYTSTYFRQKYEEYRKTVLQNPRNQREGHVLSTVSTSQGPLSREMAMIPPISGNRALSNHIMWRSVNRNGFGLNRPELPTIPDSVVIDVDDDQGKIP